MKSFMRLLLCCFFGLALLGFVGSGMAGYKTRNWSVNARESYPASLSSEGVTIAVDPLFTDALAAQVFDKKDIVTRGIMPLAIVIFNDNDYAIEVDGLSVELIRDDDHIRTLTPEEAVNSLFSKDKSRINPSIPKGSNQDALKDFGDKFLMDKVVAPHDKGGGFVYLKVYNPDDLAAYLSKATVYIPNVYRRDDGSRLIFFEIELKTAVSTGSPK
jgi:hypothetical protein